MARELNTKGPSVRVLRVQDWRVISSIEGNLLLIDDIAPRGSVYEVRQ